MKEFDCLLKYIVIHLLLLGGLSSGLLGLTGFNIVEWLGNFVGLAGLDRVLYTLIGAGALIFLFKFYEDTFILPYLDETLVPTTLFNSETKPDNWNMEYKLKAPKGASHAIYWADDNKSVSGGVEKKQWNKIYRSWDKIMVSNNNGVAKVDNIGEAVLKFRKPHGRLCYRWVLGPNKLSKVFCEIIE